MAVKLPETRSGSAVLLMIDDALVSGLRAGDVVVRMGVAGLEPVVVDAVREGVAFDDSKEARPYAVLVVEGSAPLSRGTSLTYDSRDLCLVAVDEAS